MSIFTKKIVFICSILFLAIPSLMIFIQETCDYNAHGKCWENWSLIGNIGKITLWPAILFFTTALITYPLKQNVFEAWKKFAVWAVPAVFIFTYFITNNESGGGFFTMDFSIYFLAIVYSLFFLISLIIIGVSAFRSRNKS